MRRTRTTKTQLTAFFALATALAAASPARAETIYLSCGGTILTIDTTNNTANNAGRNFSNEVALLIHNMASPDARVEKLPGTGEIAER